MAIPKIVGAQRDFASGELDESVKRADEQPAMKSGARQISNWRILNGGQATNRPGRRVLFLEAGRVEQVTMSPGNVFYLAFGDGYLKVYNAAGTVLLATPVKGDGATPIPWTAANANGITFAVIPGVAPQVVIAYGQDFPLNVPQVLTWDGISQTSTWTLSNFAEFVSVAGKKQTLFTRISPPNITMVPTGLIGDIVLTTSAPVFVAGMVGTRIAWCGRQVVITGIIDSKHAYATCAETLPHAQRIEVGTGSFPIGPSGIIGSEAGAISIGDELVGGTSGAHGIVVQFFNSGAFQEIVLQIIPSAPGSVGYFSPGETAAGPNGSVTVGINVGLWTQAAVSVWDDEVMNPFRGYPKSVFFDQDRLGFCDFAVLPQGIAWSAIGLTTNFSVSAVGTVVNADSAIFELAPGASHALYVVSGMESNEFVFCDDAVYYIPITAQLPLTAGTVAFNKLTTQGSAANVPPRSIQQSILYLRAGGASFGAVQTPGYYFRPHVVDTVSTLHSHLLTASPVVALAVPSAPQQFEENYAYALRADGTVVVARFELKMGLLDAGPEGKPKMGWLPWTSAGTVKWISANAGDLIFQTAYGVPAVDSFNSDFSNEFGPDANAAANVVEAQDDSLYLDSAIAYNAPAIPTPLGKGPLWYLAGKSVNLIDQVYRSMGVYQVDSNGFLVPQGKVGENLASPTLYAGFAWTAVLEPFVPDAPPGQNVGQRMNKRRVSRMTIYVSNSSGFLMARLFSGPLTPTSPALGTQMNSHRIAAYETGDNAALAPPLREQAYRWRPLGRSFDPRVAVIKDSPGPLLAHEIGLEASV